MDYKSRVLTIQELYKMIVDGDINLRPSYQRNFIWGKKDQQSLIDSILKGYPLPNFFIYKNPEGLYEMVDGQQRAETICRFIKGTITDSNKQHFSEIQDIQKFWKYELTITEIRDVDKSKGENIANFYALVNKQGSHLNISEINKAQYANTPILTMIEELMNSEDMAQLDIFNSKTKSRMNDRALIEELVAYLRSGLYDKRDAVEEMFDADLKIGEVSSLKDSFMTIIKRITILDNVFPINETRYRQRNDFFTLFSFINSHKDISDEILTYQYKLLVWIDKKKIISPRNEGCYLLYKYAINCVSQSNSRIAREKRLAIFNQILCHNENDSDEEYDQLIDYLVDICGNIEEKNIGEFYLIDVECC